MEITKEACRVCLRGPLSAPNDQWESDSINEVDNRDNISYSQKFTACTRIPINLQYAKKICKRCIYHLKKAYTFHMICQRTEQILQNYMQRESKRKVKYATRDQQQSINNNDNNINNLSIKIEPNAEDPEASNNGNKLLSTARVKTEKIDYDNDESTSQADNSDDPDYSENEADKNINDNKPLSCFKPRKQSIINIDEDSSNQNKPKRKASEEEPSLICEICGNIYKRRHLLANHMRMHSGKKDFKCEICGKEFLLGTYLTSHMKTHTGIKNFNCSFCTRKFYSNGKRTAHEKIHRGETSYQCNICDKIFKYSQSLKKHLFIHSGMKPHKCPECDKEFRTMCNLRQHLSSAVHKDKSNIQVSTTTTGNHDRQPNEHNHEELASTIHSLQQPYMQIFNNANIPTMRQEQPQQQQQRCATDFSLEEPWSHPVMVELKGAISWLFIICSRRHSTNKTYEAYTGKLNN